MLKSCNGCKRNLEIDKFCSYKKSICKDCLNEKSNVVIVIGNLILLIYPNT